MRTRRAGGEHLRSWDEESRTPPTLFLHAPPSRKRPDQMRHHAPTFESGHRPGGSPAASPESDNSHWADLRAIHSPRGISGWALALLE